MTQHSNEPSRWTVGRDRGCDVVIDHEDVAPVHCVVTETGGRCVVEPRDGAMRIGSGTGKSILAKQAIAPEDSIWLGTAIRLPWLIDAGCVSSGTIGRASDNDVVINREGISGLHARYRVDRNGTVTITDADSRNGIFVDSDFVERVASTVLLPGQRVFFGSMPISCDELLERITPSPLSPTAPANVRNERIAIRGDNGKRESVPGKSVWNVVATLIPTLVTVGVLFWWFGSGDTAATTEEVNLPEVTVPEVVAAIASPPLSAAPPTDVTEPTLAVVAEEPMGEPVPANAPLASDCLYWILLRHQQTQKDFRLGGGVAIDANRILTTASLVQAIDDMTADGFDDPRVVHLATGAIEPIRTRSRNSVFDDRTKVAAELVRQYEQSDEAKPTATVLNMAMAAASAVDVGWLQVDQTVGSVTLDTNASFRPGRKVSATAAAFDQEDPFFEPSEPIRVEELFSRITSVSEPIDGLAGSLLLGPERQLGVNLLGSPLVENNRVVGLIVFQSEDAKQWEAIPASAIQTLLAPSP